MDGDTAAPVHIVPFSHLDLFWAGTREECLSRGCHIIRTALDLLEREPDYRFQIESTNFLEHHLATFPEDAGRIRRLAEGERLELLPSRSLIYSHLPAGETTIRNLRRGLAQARAAGAPVSDVVAMSDIPGATPQLPQMLRQCGFRRLVLSRGCPERTDFARWHGLDGTAVDAYYPLHYAALVESFFRDDPENVEADRRFEAHIGPSPHPRMMPWGMDLYVLNEDIFLRLRRRNTDARFRRFHFATFREFFDRQPPVGVTDLYGEIPSQWPNIESSWPDVWPFDLRAEAWLRDAEWLGALERWTTGRAFPRGEFDQAWDRLLDGMDHNQNGLGGPSADADKLRLKTHAADTARFFAEDALRRLAARVRAPSAAVFPVVAFNSLSWRRDETIRARAALYGATRARREDVFARGRPVRLRDEAGREIPFRLHNHLAMVADTVDIEFPARDLPAFGARAFFLEAGEPSDFPPAGTLRRDADVDRAHGNRPAGEDVYENDHLRLSLDRVTGEWSLFDRRRGRERLDRAGLVALEERGGDYISAMPLSGRRQGALVDRIDWTRHDALGAEVEIVGALYGQPFRQRLSVPAHRAEIELETRIQWRGGRYVRLEMAFPFAGPDEPAFRYGVPFGQVRFPESIYHRHPGSPGRAVACSEDANITSDVTDTSAYRLARLWVDLSDDTGGVTVAADHRLWRFEDRVAANALLRGIRYCSGGARVHEDGSREVVGRPPPGVYVFRHRLALHDVGDPVARVGWELNHPVRPVAVGYAAPGETPGLTLPVFPESGDSGVIVSWVKPSDADGLPVLRCFESRGQKALFTLPTPDGRVWRETDPFERSDEPKTAAQVEFKPYEIKTFVLSRS